MSVTVGPKIDLNDVVRVSEGESVALSPEHKSILMRGRKYLMNRLSNGEVIYGVNTGFGSFSNTVISNAQLVQLQKNLIRSHSMGVGEVFTPEQTRAIMLLRAQALSQGHSGIRPEVVEKILEFLNADILPWIPGQGSVGASGDLAPLAHLALSLIGEGRVWDNEKKTWMATEVLLKQRKIEPLTLEAKEGLSLINGCQVMTAVGLLACARAKQLAYLADIAGALTLEALRGSRSAFHPSITQVRPHKGEIQTAANLRSLLGETSEIGESHLDCGRVQDPYSLRCMPAVHGATKDALNNVIRVLEVEANSSTDNPLVFDEEGLILSCGNFHGEPVAFQMDFLAIALSAMSSMSECRIEKLINPAMSSGLPAFLAKNGGLNSGHMIVQVAAAALVSENKILSHPASVDSLPTSADKEDHVSMGTIGARKLVRVLENAEQILAMELLSSTQGLGFLTPMKSTPHLEKVIKWVRERAPFAEEDRIFAHDVEAIIEGLRGGDWHEFFEKNLSSELKLEK